MWGKNTGDKSKKNVEELRKGYPTYDRRTGEKRTIPSKERPNTVTSRFRSIEETRVPREKEKERWGDKPAYGANRDRISQTRKLEKEL